MRSMTLSLLVLAVASACGTPPEAPPPDEFAPEFEVGGGQMGADSKPLYPGPYGVGIGSVIPDYSFLGYPKATQEKDTLKKIQLGQFYNPTGTEVFPEGSPYGAGRPKPKVILVDRSAVWCEPCNLEARTVLPGKHAAYGDASEFVLALDEGPQRGSTPNVADLRGWVTRYRIDYPATLNPSTILSAVVGVDAYPGNIIVRTKDMRIVTWVAGAPDDAFWRLYEDTMNGRPVLPTDPR